MFFKLCHIFKEIELVIFRKEGLAIWKNMKPFPPFFSEKHAIALLLFFNLDLKK